ncbi:FMN-dependent alpha-hydroxy acid dehydrogenase [Sanghuangporus baumii]|uniref:FMN-dependent alpha-hydroxy acid dehydrogenase n=1 Tax=Sanghuangporus baumii TaxID=108892 RepID=A0A9Q5N0G8_SANBA|nr:FMN-dependent alpha-hydroxy acid dehydrogenase [Sanghuangporus baumii]
MDDFRSIASEEFISGSFDVGLGLERVGRWTTHKWVLFLSVLSVLGYSIAALVFAILTWYQTWDHADVMIVADGDVLILATLCASLLLLAALVGLTGTLLNSRPLLAIYALLLWPAFISLLSVGYVSYKRASFSLDRKLNMAWSKWYTDAGRAIIQDSLRCCGFSDPTHEAVYGPGFAGGCYARTLRPGCKGPLLRFERANLGSLWRAAFSAVPLHIINIIICLLCANHVTRTFGTGLLPRAYRLKLKDVKTDAKSLLEHFVSGNEKDGNEFGDAMSMRAMRYPPLMARTESSAGVRRKDKVYEYTYRDDDDVAEDLRRELSLRRDRMTRGDKEQNGKNTKSDGRTFVQVAANKWSTYNIETYRDRRIPLLSTVSVRRIEELARAKMEKLNLMNAYMYVFGSAGTCSTERFNREAFDEWRIVPHDNIREEVFFSSLHRSNRCAIETIIFGKKYSSPLFIAPIGVQGILHPDAELASARAAGSLGVPYIMSTASTRSIEEVAEANGPGNPRWYQLYWPVTHEITVSLLKRAKAAGFTALVVTLDTMNLGWRPHDLDTAYLPFAHSTGCAVGLSDPVFMKRMGLEPWPFGKHVEFPYEPKKLEKRIEEGDEDVQLRKVLGGAWLAETNSGKYRTWEDIKLLREAWDGPIILKGIQSVEDAETAVDWVDGIVVSNHGGRQVDGAVASLAAMDKIGVSEKMKAAQATGKFTVLFDSGIRTGSDIIKALALGAQGILLGRPFMYGLCLAGEEGVAEQIKSVLSDFEITLGLSGYKNIQEIQGNRGAHHRHCYFVVIALIGAAFHVGAGRARQCTMYKLSLLPVGLIALLLSTPALAQQRTTPADPFYHIAKTAQRPPEPPVCCLRPLPSIEPGPAEEVLSFEEWKAKQEQELLQKQKDGTASTKTSSRSVPSEVQKKESEAEGGPPPLEPPAPPPPQFRVPLTDRFNYASLDCSARVHYAHRSARSASNLLSSKKDKYMLSPCNTPGEDKFVVVELCEDIRIDTVQLANFEFFSGMFKDFSVSVARTYTTDPEEWTSAGTYRAKNIRGVQSFHPPASLRDFYRYIRIDFHSYYGNEFYCPVSLLRVYGLTHLEHWKWEEWEVEYRSKNEGSIRSIAATSVVVAGDHESSIKATSELQETRTAEESESRSDSSHFERTTTSIHHLSRMRCRSPTKATSELQETRTAEESESRSDSSHSERTTTSVPLAETDESLQKEATSTSSSRPDSSSLTNEVSKSFEEFSKLSFFERPDTQSLPISSPSAESIDPLESSSSTDSSTQADSSLLSLPSESASQPESSVLSYDHSSSVSSGDASRKSDSSITSVVSSTPMPTIIPHESRAVPAVTSTGESIYRTIMTRLSVLEVNSTLYLRYVEEQTRFLRDALTRLEEDVGRLEGLSKATTQSFQKIINEMDRQRRRLEREHGELQTRVDFLTDEVVLEKRLGIAQLCLLLVVLVFMALTRGSRGEPFISEISGSRRHALREWGRRQFSNFSSGEWVSKPRTESPVRMSEDFVKSPIPIRKMEHVKFPIHQGREDGDQTPRGSASHLAVPSSSKGKTPAEIRAPHPRQFVSHRPRTPTSAGFAIYTPATRSAGLLGASNSNHGMGARPRMRRASSHSTPGPVQQSLSMREGGSGGSVPKPVSAKKWAKTAHLHEIRRKSPGHSSTEAQVQLATYSSSTTPNSNVQGRPDRENSKTGDRDDEDLKHPLFTEAQVQLATYSSSTTPNSNVQGRPDRENSKTGDRGDEDLKHPLSELPLNSDDSSQPHSAREPFSVSPLQNRSRQGGGTEYDRFQHGQTCQPNANSNPKIVEIDTESDNWSDTDAVGSDVDEQFA